MSSPAQEYRDDLGFTIGERHDHMLEAIEDVYNAWTWLDSAATLSEQATGYEKVSNAMHDLLTWHPRWDYEHGVLKEPKDG